MLKPFQKMDEGRADRLQHPNSMPQGFHAGAGDKQKQLAPYLAKAKNRGQKKAIQG